MGKLVRKRRKQGGETAVAASTLADLLDRALARALGSDEPLTIGEAARRIAERLEMLDAALEAAVAAVGRLEDLMRGHRRRRDRVRPKLYEYLTHLRMALQGTMGREAADDFLGIHGPTPEDSEELHDLAGEVIARTADPAWPVPEARTKAVKYTPAATARSLAKMRDELGAALEALETGEAELAVAKAAKKRVAAAFDYFHGRASRYLESGLELAGLDDLVAQVRPGVGRRGRPPKEKTLAERGGAPQLAAGAAELPGKAEEAARLLAEVAELADPAEIAADSAADGGQSGDGDP